MRSDIGLAEKSARSRVSYYDYYFCSPANGRHIMEPKRRTRGKRNIGRVRVCLSSFLLNDKKSVAVLERVTLTSAQIVNNFSHSYHVARFGLTNRNCKDRRRTNTTREEDGTQRKRILERWKKCLISEYADRFSFYRSSLYTLRNLITNTFHCSSRFLC